MSEHKKSGRKIEDVISELLDGDIKQNAMDFVTYLRDNKFTLARTSTGESWKIGYKGKGVGRILWLTKNNWNVCPYADYTKEYEDYLKRENLQEIIMNNLFFCHRCHPHSCAPRGVKEEEFKGHTKKYFGIEVHTMCKHWDAFFHNPDPKTIDCIKKMIEFNKQTIISNSKG